MNGDKWIILVSVIITIGAIYSKQFSLDLFFKAIILSNLLQAMLRDSTPQNNSNQNWNWVNRLYSYHHHFEI